MLQSPLALEMYAQDVLREHRRRAAQAALIAQLPHSPMPRPDLAARLRLARGLRALAIRLDPAAVTEPALASAAWR